MNQYQEYFDNPKRLSEKRKVVENMLGSEISEISFTEIENQNPKKLKKSFETLNFSSKKKKKKYFRRKNTKKTNKEDFSGAL